MTMFRFISVLCLSVLLVACQDSEPKNKRPPPKPKFSMDACARLPAEVIANVLGSDGTFSAKPETFDDDHQYAGGCRYQDNTGTTRALLAIKIDKGGNEFNFLPIRTERSNLFPTKPVAKHKAARRYDGGLWWTSKEDVMFQLTLYDSDGQSVLQDEDKHHAVAAKVMEGHPEGDMPDTQPTSVPEKTSAENNPPTKAS